MPADRTAHLSALVEASPDAMLCADARGRITFWNGAAARLFGHSAEEADGLPVHCLLDGRRTSLCASLFRRLSRTVRLPSKTVRIEGVRADGTPVALDVRASVWENGDERGLCAVVRPSDASADRTRQLEAAIRAAEEANRSKSQFLANMSHELRTPLNAVIGYSEILLEEMAGDVHAAHQDDVRRIHKAGRHLLAMIADVLQLAKLDAGAVEIHPETVDLAAEAVSWLSAHMGEARENGSELVLDIADGYTTMVVDRDRLRQCVSNLLSNACRFTKGGKVTLRVAVDPSAHGDVVRISVADTGAGMAPEVIEQLFGDFTQSDYAASIRHGGTGLGLALTHRTCVALGGHITASSVPGQGSCFTIHLPARPDAEIEAPFATMRSRSSPTSPETPCRPVLVIDDDPSARDILERLLRRAGFEPTCVGSAEEGLRAAKAIGPEIVILDVEMPERDGWEVLSTLKSDPETRDCPVIMLTVVDDKHKARRLGAADHLTKPIDRDTLVASVARFAPKKDMGYLLVVEDEPDVRELIARMLRKEGWTVETAADGMEALGHVRRAPPLMVLLDLAMPHTDGFAVVEQLRANPAWSAIPVVVLTGREVDADDRQRLSGATIMGKDRLASSSLFQEIGRIAVDDAVRAKGGRVHA